jgi:hypothetical protein
LFFVEEVSKNIGKVSPFGTFFGDFDGQTDGSKCGPEVDRKWTGSGPEVDRRWTGSGPDVDHFVSNVDHFVSFVTIWASCPSSRKIKKENGHFFQN